MLREIRNYFFYVLVASELFCSFLTALWFAELCEALYVGGEGVKGG